MWKRYSKHLVRTWNKSLSMSDTLPYIHEEHTQITSADTDFTKILKPGSLINMLIQIAWHHAEKLGFGMEFLHREELVWMLSRMHIKIYDYPSWNEHLSFTTWPKGIRRLFYLRDFEAYGLKNHLMAQATSEWLLIDLKTRRPKLFNPENNIFNQNKDKHALMNEVPVIQDLNEKYETFNNTACYSDLDLNQHLTTTRYIDWMLDTLPIELLRRNKCKELIVNFIREVHYNEQVEILRSGDEDSKTFQFAFRKSGDAKDLFRGQVSF